MIESGYLIQENSEGIWYDGYLPWDSGSTPWLVTIQDGAHYKILQEDGSGILLEQFQSITTFTADSVLIPSGAFVSITADSIVVNRIDKTVTSDSIILKKYDTSVTADSIVLKKTTDTVTADSVVLKTSDKTYTADSIVLKESEKQVTSDSIVKLISDKTVTSDSIVRKTLDKTFTADSLLLTQYDKTFTADSVILKSNEKDITSDGIVAIRESKTVTADGIVAIRVSKTFTVDSVVSRRTEKNLTADSVVRDTLEKTFTVDSYIREKNCIWTIELSADTSWADIEKAYPFLLQEDGYRILLENGGRILATTGVFSDIGDVYTSYINTIKPITSYGETEMLWIIGYNPWLQTNHPWLRESGIDKPVTGYTKVTKHHC